MRPISEIRLEPIEGGVPVSTVVRSNERGPEVVAGHVLEAQFGLGREYLLLVTDGSPFEEILHFHLLDDKLRPIDEVSLGRIYNAGIVKDLTVESESSLTFSFFGGDLWRLEVFAKPRIRLHAPLVSAVHYSRISLRGHRLDLHRESGAGAGS